MPLKFLITLAALLFCSPAWSYTAIDAGKTILTNGSATDTKLAMDYIRSKAEDGWVMTIGTAGATYEWTAASLYEIHFDAPYNFTVQGASPTDRPTIHLETAFLVGYAPGKLITFKDVIFTAGAIPRQVWFFVGGSGPTPGFRFTNCKWSGSWPGQLFVIGDPGGNGGSTAEGPYGLFDNCQTTGVTSFNIYCLNGNETVSPSWRRPMDWGTAKAVYFEDCDFRSPTFGGGSALTDAFNGGAFVFRHNRVENMMVADHGADHISNATKSVLKHEIMHNEFRVTEPSRAIPWMIFFRGGTAAIFDNTFEADRAAGASANYGIVWAYYRASAGAGPSNSIYDRWYTPLNTTITSGSNGKRLPQSTINVTSTTAMIVQDLPGPATYIGNLKVTTNAGVQTVDCTGKTATTFTGCTGGTGTMSTGGAVTRASDYGTTSTQQPGCGTIFAKVASGSNGAPLPQSTINVESTLQFPSNPGLISVNGSDVTCTGKTATSFTGCSGGSGTLATAQAVFDKGQDPRWPNEPWGRMPIYQWNNRTIGTGIGNLSNISGEVRNFVAEGRDIFTLDTQTAQPTDTGNWIDSYVEYTYPHPLRLGGSSAPVPPSNVRIAP